MPWNLPKAFAVLTISHERDSYIYWGEEIGMTNYPFETLDQVEKILVPQLCIQSEGVPLEEIMDAYRVIGRDSLHADTIGWKQKHGFSTGDWVVGVRSYEGSTFEGFKSDSIFYTYQKLG